MPATARTSIMIPCRGKIFSACLMVAILLGASGRGTAMDDGQTVTTDTLVFHTPYIRATPPNAPVSGGYVIIENREPLPDRLVGASAEFAGHVQIHSMTMEGDIMQMRELAEGLPIPPGGEVRLEPGGYHLMFMALREDLKPGEKRAVTLEFERAGPVLLEFPVKRPGASQSGHDN